LHATNNFPEFTGRLCPAPCETSCVLSINDNPVAIEHVERAIADRGFEEGWITPQSVARRTGKRVAILGSGPAGLAAAQQLNRAGHWVTVFERHEEVGGLLSLGIPGFKLPKEIVRRRIDIMVAEGIVFRPNTNVGVDVPISDLRREFDAVCLAGGSTIPRTLDIPGSDLPGVHLALEFLRQQNRVDAGWNVPEGERIDARGKQVVVLGGGDTGSDCVGTAFRQGARAVVQFEILPQPPKERRSDNPWPKWSVIFRSSHAHEEGGARDYNILTKSLSGANGPLERLHAVRLEWGPPDNTGRPVMKELPGSEFEIETELVLLALGFLRPQHEGMITDLGVELDPRGNVATDGSTMTSVPGVFAAGDMARGQSLVVWAIAEGRRAAHGIDSYLMNGSSLPNVSLESWA
jgi:glutamate synthase (NADPH/NADH) small chain